MHVSGGGYVDSFGPLINVIIKYSEANLGESVFGVPSEG